MKWAALILVVVITSCSVNNHYYKDGDKWIPQDFNPAKDVLLIEHYPGKEKWSKSMEEFVEKHYKWQYVIVDKKDILGTIGKYADRQKYKFAILWTNESSTSSSTFSGGGTTYMYSGMQLDMAGHFLDRIIGKEYPMTRKINNYGWQGYVPFFNTIIRHFKN